MVRRNDKELHSGTLYLANNERVRLLLDRWIAVNVKMEHTGLFEQKNLELLLLGTGADGLQVLNLPDTYCQIYDTMADAGDPVVEQFQASRKFRGAA